MVVIVWSIYTNSGNAGKVGNSGNAAKVGNKGIVSNVLKVRESIVTLVM